MSELYPLKFKPALKEKVWGGDALVTRYNKKPAGSSNNIGESWELSAVSGNLSVISNGKLAGNNIEELIEIYMGDLIGDSVFEKFGNEFPLLIKLIEAREDLSIQVHPDNALAKKRHHAYGKTEMWYILESGKGSRLFSGFLENVTKDMYLKAVEEGKLPDILNVETVEPGDTFFTPAGRIHAIGAGTVLAEIQQTSDITYRLFDWNRKSSGKEKRELHTDLALDAIDFSAKGKNKIKKEPELNKAVKLVSCEFFDTNVILFNKAVKREYYLLDSFVIYICVDGEFSIRWEGNTERVSKGETVLLPALIKEVTLEPVKEARLLEIFINSPGC
ncbi:MAG TPA: mannose-6-phosphate isomerase [Bacteroidales bacterium]|nr:mannose-6-phosphate isomerase [Bacteroidales bacterium]HPT21536.1 mannose-6-phosphate isomerase [Bacteroidales bacterium]